VAGFVQNYDLGGGQGFSENIYTWQRRTEVGPGMGNIREVGDPKQQVRDAHIKEGWDYYRRLVDNTAALLTMKGVQPEDDLYDRVMRLAKAGVVDEMEKQGNEDWLSEYNDPDTSKYEDRARAFNELLGDTRFAADHNSDTLVQSMRLFLGYRRSVQRALAMVDEAGGSQTLGAQSNEMMKRAYDSQVERLMVESPEFRTWHDRYFPHDDPSAKK
jgi:hypothetical protein